MSISAILMMVFGLMMTWGGASLCLYIALKKNAEKKDLD